MTRHERLIGPWPRQRNYRLPALTLFASNATLAEGVRAAKSGPKKRCYFRNDIFFFVGQCSVTGLQRAHFLLHRLNICDTQPGKQSRWELVSSSANWTKKFTSNSNNNVNLFENAQPVANGGKYEKSRPYRQCVHACARRITRVKSCKKVTQGRGQGEQDETPIGKRRSFE